MNQQQKAVTNWELSDKLVELDDEELMAVAGGRRPRTAEEEEQYRIELEYEEQQVREFELVLTSK